MRKNILQTKVISNLMHMENMVLGIAFGTAVSNFRNCIIKGYKGTYNQIKLSDIVNSEPVYFPVKENRFAQVSSDNFAKIPGAPVAYWVSENMNKAFENTLLADHAMPKQGIATADNNRYLRLWYECQYNNIFFNCHSHEESIESICKWYPYNKGGDFRKWYGNNDFVVNWHADGFELRNDKKAVLRNPNFYFKECASWSLISSSATAFRYKQSGFIFDVAGMSFFSDKLFYLMGFCNTIVAYEMLKIIAPTINFQVGDIAKLPIIYEEKNKPNIDALVEKNIYISKSDWDAFETSWDFTKHPLVMTSGQLLVNRDSSANTQLSTTYYPLTNIAQAYQRWEEETNARFTQLKANEEELNRIFIDIYGLQDELTPEVEDKDVTVRKADLQRDIKSLLSYAVGCMFGRYSLDVEGLAFAGGTWDDSKYVTFKPDEDNVIPITDEDYFEDDIIGRLIAWLKVVYGAETLEENLRFIADALGTSGDTARQKIRNYFLKDFFKDHCKIYQKRPIYWLYDSGKQNGFKALIYMHRYDADTSGQVRAEYLGKMEETYESEINRMQDIMDNGAGREVALAGKRKEKLQKQLHECRDYDAVLGHIALASIAIDLDDGVKVNYVKVQTAKDGKLLPILAKI